MFTSLFPYILLAPVFVYRTQALCGGRIKWSHRINIADVYGVWYAIGYAQHNPDMTNVPNEVGCVSLYITDADNEFEESLFDGSIPRKNYSTKNWRSTKSNPWSENSMAGSWLDVRLKRSVRRSLGEKRVRVLWDEDGHTLEQAYLYNQDKPGLWTAEQLRPLERLMVSRGIDVWFPDDPPRHPDVIRLLKVTPHTLILNHCSEVGNGGIFSLILRRSPSTVKRWEWHQYRKLFYTFEVPNVYRFSATCAAGTRLGSIVFVLICFISLNIILK